MKRLFDILVALVGLTLLAVPLGIVAVAVKLSSRGPIFYRQQRIGRGGMAFPLCKFRSMYTGSAGTLLTVEGDARVTPVGRYLRRWKLDELPQLWNVLCGQMSIIGPRPEVPRYVQHYNAEQRRLLEQTPGLAGLAQLVYPHEANLLLDHPHPEEFYLRELMPKKIAVDLHYESYRSFWTDLRLIAEMALLVLDKSYRVDSSLAISSDPTHGSDTPNGRENRIDTPSVPESRGGR